MTRQLNSDDLIAALVVDHDGRPKTSARADVRATIFAAAIAAVTSLALFGVRSDIAAALTNWRFDAKLAIAAVLLVAGISALRASVRPERSRPLAVYLAAPAALLALTVAIELWMLPAGTWRQAMLGQTALSCLGSILVVSLLPLAAMFVVLRNGAPASPATAGASIGVVAAAVTTLVYALHCREDSPLFVVVWYLLAQAAVIAVGALAGRKVLSW